LSDISWRMRLLSQNIAQPANRKDKGIAKRDILNTVRHCCCSESDGRGIVAENSATPAKNGQE